MVPNRGFDVVSLGLRVCLVVMRGGGLVVVPVVGVSGLAKLAQQTVLDSLSQTNLLSLRICPAEDPVMDRTPNSFINAWHCSKKSQLQKIGEFDTVAWNTLSATLAHPVQSSGQYPQLPWPPT